MRYLFSSPLFVLFLCFGNAFAAAREKPLFFLPKNYTTDKQWPVLVYLHGYNTSGYLQNFYLGFSRIVDDMGFIFVLPEGTKNSKGKRFWNATEACCAPKDSTVDDVAYLEQLLTETEQKYSIDRSRVYLYGHSNGGYMAYRFACDRSELVTGIVSLAGAMEKDPSKCNPSKPVSVLQIHGTKDEKVPYEGSNRIPSARESIGFWTTTNSCDLSISSTFAHRFVWNIFSKEKETTEETWTHCQDGTQVSLWTLQNANHMPLFVPNGSFTKASVAFLLRQRRY